MVEHPTHAWKYELAQHGLHVQEKRLWWGRNGKARFPRLKIFLHESREGLVPIDVWRHEETGTTDDGGAEIKAIFGNAVFDNPKPTSLVQRILRLSGKGGSLVLDSFAGSGTTGHAVLAMNKADGGSRRFILVEMEENVCRNVTAQRLSRVIEGYTTAKTNGRKEEVPGLGGGFRYCTLGATLFDETGRIRHEVSFAELAAHVYFVETGEPIPKRRNGQTPLLGVHNGTAVYLLYNGALKDKSPDGGNALTRAVLASLPRHDGPKVIYGTSCRLGSKRLREQRITFRQIPYEVRVR
jgi:site-specific DNA-methyltransferase (adenine-specific)/adenine-specific DNA-methyltransferase